MAMATMMMTLTSKKIESNLCVISYSENFFSVHISLDFLDYFDLYILFSDRTFGNTPYIMSLDIYILSILQDVDWDSRNTYIYHCHVDSSGCITFKVCENVVLLSKILATCFSNHQHKWLHDSEFAHAPSLITFFECRLLES